MTTAKEHIAEIVRRQPDDSSYNDIVREPTYGPSGLVSSFVWSNQGRRASRLPLAFISRAFGAKANDQKWNDDSRHRRCGIY